MYNKTSHANVQWEISAAYFPYFFKHARFHFLSISLKKCSVSVEQKCFLKEVAIGLLKKLMNHFMNHEPTISFIIF